MIRSALLSVAAASIAVAPVSASAAANPAAKLSIAKAPRVATSMKKSSNALATPIIILLVVVGVTVGVVAVTGDSESA